MQSQTQEKTAQDGSVWSGYHGGEEMPLKGVATICGAYALAFSTLYALSHGKQRSERPSLLDVALLGATTHKLSRLLTQDWVTAPIRAPFTVYKGSSGAGEVKERPRGHGLLLAVGDLLNCPWCSGAWIAMLLGFSSLLAPRFTRTVETIFTAELISDVLHLLYGRAKKLEA